MEPVTLALGALVAGGVAAAAGVARRSGRSTQRWVQAFEDLTGRPPPDPRNVHHDGWRYGVQDPGVRGDLEISRAVRDDVRLALAFGSELPREVTHWAPVQVSDRWGPFTVRADPTDGATEWFEETAWALVDAIRATDASALTVVIRGGHAVVSLHDALPSGPGLKRCSALLREIESGAA